MTDAPPPCLYCRHAWAEHVIRYRALCGDMGEALCEACGRAHRAKFHAYARHTFPSIATIARSMLDDLRRDAD